MSLKSILTIPTFLIFLTASTVLANENYNEMPVLDPSKGQEVGSVYEAFLSPHQEPGEEKDTPSLVPSTFRSTAPSLEMIVILGDTECYALLKISVKLMYTSKLKTSMLKI